MPPRKKARIIDAAISLFADQGYFGVTIRELARKAETTEGTIYRVFKDRDNIFHQALNAVIARSLDPAQLLLMLFENQQKQDFASLVNAAVHRWYSAMSGESARLLMQACWSQNPRWRQTASAYLEKIISLLAASIEREFKITATHKLNAIAAVRTLVLALFQFKIAAQPGSARQESETVDAMIAQWLHRLPAAPCL